MVTKPLSVLLRPVDTWMFRDGRPFNQADTGASVASTIFPPYPPTVVGAIRFAMWRTLNGWDESLLGDGTNWQEKGTLGPLSFGPPVILQNGAPIFPAPLNLLVKGESKNRRMTMLAPGLQRNSDAGFVRFPTPSEALPGAKPLEDGWITIAGLKKVLAGELPAPEDLISVASDQNGPISLWKMEPKVGIGVEAGPRTTSDGRLYLSTHVRPTESISIHCTVRGYSGPELSKRCLQALGGEHRMAEIEFSRPKAFDLPSLAKVPAGGRYNVFLASPLVLEELPGSGDSLPGFPGRVVCACLGKPLGIGGWDSQAKDDRGRRKGRPLPMRQAIPAGSVIFLEGADEGSELPSCVPQSIGVDWGFGQVMIGIWTERHT